MVCFTTLQSEHEITNIWNAKIISHEGTRYVIKNVEWNQNINKSKSVQIGFTANWTDLINEPTQYKLLGEEQVVNETEYNISYKLYSDWGSGFNSEISIMNNTNEAIEEWSLEFDFDRQIDSIWNAIILKQEGTHYIIKNAEYNANIKAGQKISIGFNGSKGLSSDIPYNYNLNKIGQDVEDDFDDTDDLIDIGEIYYKETIEDDILLDSNGISYVRNQILLTAYDTISFDDISTLANMYNGQIVGFIELTNDYQIEFNENVDAEYLYQLIEELMQHPLVEYVSFNTAYELEEEIHPNDIKWKNESWNEEVPSGLNWGIEAIQAISAWDYLDKMKKVKIGVIDFMFDTNHEDLKFANVWNNPSNITDAHGSMVAGIMAAKFNNKKGIAGVCPKNKLYGFAISNNIDKNYSKINGTMMKEKYIYATLIGNNVKVINVSLKYIASQQNKVINAEILGNFLQKLLNAGYNFVIVKSAGNDNTNALNNSHITLIDNPVKNNIICVGSIDYFLDDGIIKYKLSDFSNFGERVDVVAPGRDIYSTSLNNSYISDEGTSLAAPFVSGVAGLLFSIDPNLSGEEVSAIIKITAKNTNYISSVGYGIVNAKSAIGWALDGVGTTPDTSPKGFVMGIISDLNKPVQDVKITAYEKSSNVKRDSSISNSKGEFELILKEGTYRIEISKKGYIPITTTVDVKPNQANYLEKSLLTKTSQTNTSAIVKGIVKNALTDKAINGAEVKYRKGWNNTAGSYVNTLGNKSISVTDSFGNYQHELYSGNYTAEVTKNGFITGYVNVTSSPDMLVDQNALLSPVLLNDEYRIVLSWNDTPRDLDSHLTDPTSSIQRFHVYYANNNYNDNGKSIANLDIDKTSGYGPETITMTLKQELDGIYRYSVHDYTNKSSLTSKILSLSDAQVKLYQGSILIETFNVPINQSGTLWTVFEINDGIIEAINKMSFESNTSSIR